MKYLLIAMITLGTLSVSAQHKDHHQRLSKEKMESRKIAFFTQQLDLTPEEAQVFWPVYNQYEKQKHALRGDRKGPPKLEGMDDSEANAFIEQHLKMKEESLALEREYVEKFKTVLPVTKVMQLMILERRFKEEVLRDLKKRIDRKH